MKKYIFGFVFAFTLLAFGGLASVGHAQQFSNNLYIGVQGVDVSNLQTCLISLGYDIPGISIGTALKGYFGSQTRQALMAYQVSAGLPATGFFGPLTRSKLQCSNVGQSPNPIPVPNPNPIQNGNLSLTVTNAPTTLAVGQTGSWTILASNNNTNQQIFQNGFYQNQNLSYSVIWGDENNYAAVASPQTISQFTQRTTFTHSYANAGVYNVIFTVRNNANQITTARTTVIVGNAVGPLSILSPNGGESWMIGSTQTIRWTAPQYFRATYADIKLVQYRAPCTIICPMTVTSQYIMAPYNIATNISIDSHSYVWNVGTVADFNNTMLITAPPGQYTIQICETGTSVCDSSDQPFTIYSSGTQSNLPPVINGVDAPTVLSVNQNGTWTIRATDPANGTLSYSIDWGDTNMSNTAMTVGNSFVQTSTFSHTYARDGYYTVTFTVRNNSGLTTQIKTSVNVGSSNVFCPAGYTCTLR